MRVPEPGSMPPSWLALLAALLPFLVVHLAYAVSVWEGYIPGCLPYVSGCTSISSGGRHGTGYILFKAGMIPAAVVLAAFWIHCRRWLLALGDRDGVEVRGIFWVGLISAVFLVLYTVFLGHKGDFYNLMRRFGVTVFFSFSYLAQLMLLARIRRLRMAAQLIVSRWIVLGKLAIAVLLLAIGLLSIPLKNFIADTGRLENVVEWNFALLLVGYYALTWRIWRGTESKPGRARYRHVRRA